jgi:hypothetical protein
MLQIQIVLKDIENLLEIHQKAKKLQQLKLGLNPTNTFQVELDHNLLRKNVLRRQTTF